MELGPSDWSYSTINLSQQAWAPLESGTSFTLGKFCKDTRGSAACLGGGITPGPHGSTSITTGYNPLTIGGTGPNTGLYYVDSSNFSNSAGADIHPDVKSGSSTTFSVAHTGQTACNGSNWYVWQTCFGVTSGSVNTLLNGIWDHEGGTSSTPTTGHAKFWRDEATKSQHDPAAAIEDHVAWNPTDLEQKIEATITTLDGALKTAYCGRGEPSGNFSPTTVYLKDSSANPTAFVTNTWSEGAGGGTPNGC